MDDKNAIDKLKYFMENEYQGEDIRFCSAYLFGDSKFIEKHKSLANIFNNMAIIERPNIIYIRTDTDLYINGVNIKELTNKLHLAAFFGGDVRDIKQEPCSVVISENLSFFMSMKPKNAIFLYNKGFHLTNQVASFVTKLDYKEAVFFGDLDCDGLAIYASFKEKLPNIQFFPDIETSKHILDKFSDSLPNLDVSNCSTKRLIKDNLFKLIIERKKRIEQEFLQVLFAKGVLEKPRWIG